MIDEPEYSADTQQLTVMEAVGDFAAFVRASVPPELTAGAIAFGRAVFTPPDQAAHIHRALTCPATVQAGTWRAGIE